MTFSSQTRLLSFIESLTNVVVGIVIAFTSQMILFSWFDIHVSLITHFWLTAWFTIISLVRSYVLRRWFNGLRFTRQT